MTLLLTGEAGRILHEEEIRSSWKLITQETISYEVVLADGLLEPDNETLACAGMFDGARPRRRFVIVDAVVDRLYGRRLRDYFAAQGVDAHIMPIDASEENKTIDNVLAATRAFGEFGLSRRSEPVIAIGGGVLLDIVGMSCNLFRRGVPYVRVPTTLMGLIDAGIGAKTGVNFDDHKNRLGTYYAPRAAYLDRTFLKTLDARHMANGLAEIIKIALIKDPALFEIMETFADRLIPDRLIGSNVYDLIIDRAVAGMLEELEPNLWEAKLERLVDFGHTWGPTLEMAALPEMLHGESVAVDMAFSLVLAEMRGLVTAEQRQRGIALMRRLELPIHHPLCTPDFMADALADTTRHRDGKQRTPLPKGIGEAVFVNDLTETEMAAACRTLELLSRSNHGPAGTA